MNSNGYRGIGTSDGIRVRYYFERDGWSIQQASKFELDADDVVCDPDYLLQVSLFAKSRYVSL